MFIVFVFLQGVANIITSVIPFKSSFFQPLSQKAKKYNELNRINFFGIYVTTCGTKVAFKKNNTSPLSNQWDRNLNFNLERSILKGEPTENRIELLISRQAMQKQKRSSK